MCIIVAVPQGKQVTKETIKRCWDNNPHGGGFMYNSSGKVVVHKEMHSFKRYWKAFTSAKHNFKNSSFVLHFRISTHGKINETNCHPFLVNRNLGFAHNGIISSAPPSAEFSDTYMFNEEILKKLPKDFLNSTAMVALVKQYIGSGSKLAFLNSRGDIHFINESAGVWDDGVWYSNGGYKAVQYYDFGGTKVSSVKPKYDAVNARPYATTYAPAYQPKFWDSETNLDTCDDGCDVATFPVNTTICDYCGDGLNTSAERINGVCTNCFNEILEEDRREHLRKKNKAV